MIKKSKFDLLDDEFISLDSREQNLELPSLEEAKLPELDSALVNSYQSILESDESLWWIGQPRGNTSSFPFDLDNIKTIELFLPVLAVVIFVWSFHFSFLSLLLFVPYSIFVLYFLFQKEILTRINDLETTYLITSDRILFIYPNLDETHQIPWAAIDVLKLNERKSRKEILFFLNPSFSFKSYDIYSKLSFNRPVIQGLDYIEVLHKYLQEYHRQWKQKQKK